MLSLAAAAAAPALMMSQNVSPGEAWVIMAIVYRGVLAWPAAGPLDCCAAFLPPLLLQAATTSRTAASIAAYTAGFLDLLMLDIIAFASILTGCWLTVG